jgi:hypothetical protein
LEKDFGITGSGQKGLDGIIASGLRFASKIQSICMKIKLLILTYLFSFPAMAARLYPLQTLLVKKCLYLQVRSLGGFSGECLEVQAKNKLDDTLRFFIEPGRLFESEAPGFQPLFVLQQKEVLLLPGSSARFRLLACCGDAKKKVPSFNLCYQAGDSVRQSGKELGAYLNEKRTDPAQAQAAVWCLQNRHPLSAVHSADDRVEEGLQSLLSKLTGQPIPAYRLHYQSVAGDSLPFSDQKTEITARLSYQLRTQTAIAIVLCRPEGQVLKQIARELPQKQGKYNYALRLPVADLPKGSYVVRVQEESGRILKELPFQL